MANFKFELNREGVKQLLKSQEMANICDEYANKAVSKLGEGHEVSTHVGRNRVNAEVKATSYKAKKANYKENTILKAVMG
ncbi:MAG: hypothetical protein J6H31_02755 [Butyrivibrio sp.]|nr:hypothetical protein [Butyrivibrio sp.]